MYGIGCTTCPVKSAESYLQLLGHLQEAMDHQVIRTQLIIFIVCSMPWQQPSDANTDTTDKNPVWPKCRL